MKKNTFLIISVLIMAFWGCKKPDTTPPDIRIAYPADGAFVKDTVIIKTIVVDDNGIDHVDFFLDGNLLATATGEPFQIEWNTTESSNGEHTLLCKAVDNSDNETLSESIQVTVANALFTAHFTNDWLCPDCGEGIIFISDTDGNVLGVESWTGNATVEFLPSAGMTNLPEKISVTTIKNYSFGVNLTTYLNIPVGSSWTWKKYGPDYSNPAGNVDFEFQNIPEHEGYVLSSLWASHSSSSLTLNSSYSYTFFESPMDFYLKLNTTEGPKYKWINDVTGGNYPVDFSIMSDTESKTIDLQGSTPHYRKYLYGYTTPGSHNTGRYKLDYVHGDESAYTSISVNYPPSIFSDFRTSIYFYDNYGINEYWYQSIYGEIPDSFTKIDADFNFMSASPDNFQISTTNSSFDLIRSKWRIYSSDSYNSWYIYGAGDLTQYSLPILPDIISQNFPDVNRESFELSFVDLIDHSQLNSYDDVLDVLFKSPEYFFDVVNDFRSRLKYYDPYGISQRIEDFDDKYLREEEYEMPYYR